MRRNTNFRIAGEKNFTLRLESKRWFPTTLSLSIVVFVQVTRATTLSQESHLSENAVRPSWNLSAGFIPARIDISLRCPRILFLLEHTAALFFLPFVRPSEWRAMSHDRTISDAEDREIKGETEVTTVILWKLWQFLNREPWFCFTLFPISSLPEILTKHFCEKLKDFDLIFGHFDLRMKSWLSRLSEFLQDRLNRLNSSIDRYSRYSR